MGVTEVLDVFGQVAEEEDVGFADFAGDFDLEFLLAYILLGGGAVLMVMLSIRVN